MCNYVVNTDIPHLSLRTVNEEDAALKPSFRVQTSYVDAVVLLQLRLRNHAPGSVHSCAWQHPLTNRKSRTDLSLLLLAIAVTFLPGSRLDCQVTQVRRFQKIGSKQRCLLPHVKVYKAAIYTATAVLKGSSYG